MHRLGEDRVLVTLEFTRHKVKVTSAIKTHTISAASPSTACLCIRIKFYSRSRARTSMCSRMESSTWRLALTTIRYPTCTLGNLTAGAGYVRAVPRAFRSAVERHGTLTTLAGTGARPRVGTGRHGGPHTHSAQPRSHGCDHASVVDEQVRGGCTTTCWRWGCTIPRSSTSHAARPGVKQDGAVGCEASRSTPAEGRCGSGRQG